MYTHTHTHTYIYTHTELAIYCRKSVACLPSKCHPETKRWADAKHGNDIIDHILDLTNKSHVYSLYGSVLLPTLSSPHSNALPLTHALSWSLHYLPLFPLLSVWYKKPVIHFQLIIWINKFDLELFSLQR